MVAASTDGRKNGLVSGGQIQFEILQPMGISRTQALGNLSQICSKAAMRFK
jgi:hypothetical protein